jgi:hypothetical protein
VAATQYRSKVQLTRANRRRIFDGFVELIHHLDAWNLELTNITRPATGQNANFVVVTISDPIPADQIDHLGLVAV